MEALATRVELVGKARHGGDAVEVGVQRGDFSEEIWQAMQPGRMWLVDCWQFQPGPYELDCADVPQSEQDAIYASVVERFADRPNVEIIRAFSTKAVERFANNSLDLVYIDACHLYDAVAADLRHWWPKVKPGGMFAGHDYFAPHCDRYIQVRRAVDDWCKQVNRSIDYTAADGYGSWAIIK